MSKIKFPMGVADVLTAVYAAIIAAVIENGFTQLTIAQLTGACTLNLTLDSNLRVGEQLVVRVSADGTNRVLTLGTGMTGAAVTITANKSWCLTFYFDGTAFVLKSATALN
jgi:hypothetical protein